MHTEPVCDTGDVPLSRRWNREAQRQAGPKGSVSASERLVHLFTDDLMPSGC